jgi:ABC-type oligopeptide transport system substrate-binding subunit
MSNPEGFQLLKKNEIDWVGFPLWRYDRNLRGGPEAQEMASPPVATFIWRFNIEKFPYHHPKLRKAFSLALCRKELIKRFNYPADPAFSLLIPSHSQIHRDLEKEVEDVQKSRDFFSEALQELNLKKEAFPTLIISYPKGDDREVIASWTKEQWEKNLGIQCRLEPLEWPVLLKQLLAGDFQVSGVFWSPLIDDPIYTLNLFRYFTDTPNFMISGQSAFFDLLQLIDRETDLYKRESYLKSAEEILISEAPVIPLFRTGYFALVKQHLIPSWNHKLGIIDIKWTCFSDRKN